MLKLAIKITEQEKYKKFILLGEVGGVLLSHAASRIVSSALKGLTTVFGMGTGVTPSQ